MIVEQRPAANHTAPRHNSSEHPSNSRDRSFYYVALLRTGLILLSSVLLAIARWEPALKLNRALQFLDSTLVLWCLFHLSILVGFEWLGRLRNSIRFHVSIDVVFACALVWWTGGVQSFFLPILYASVLSCSAFCGPRVALVLASVATLNLVVMTVSDFYGWSPARWNGVSPFGIQGRGPFVIMCLVGEGIAFHLIAILGARLMGGLRRAERINRLIVSNIGDGILVLDERGRFQLINDQALKILGLSPAERWRDRRPYDVFRRQSDEALLKALQRPKAREFQIDWECDPGRSVPLTVRMSAIVPDFGKRSMWLVTIHDRSYEQRAAQAEMRVQRLKEIEDLALGIVHEIRNPLASLRGCVQELVRGELAPEQSERFSAIILREADRLDRIVSEFFEISRATPSKREAVDLVKVLRDVVDSLHARPDVDPAAVVVECESTEAWTPGDQEMLYRVFLNLGINAIEARSEEPLSVTYRITEREGSLWEVSVRDNGVGMEAETRERIFHAFFSTKVREGGLGLALVERIVHGHDGSIVVDSAPGEGTSFLVTLPQHDRIAGDRRRAQDDRKSVPSLVGVKA